MSCGFREFQAYLPVNPLFFLGCGYEYLKTDGDDKDMTMQGVFINLGLKGEF